MSYASVNAYIIVRSENGVYWLDWRFQITHVGSFVIAVKKLFFWKCCLKNQCTTISQYASTVHYGRLSTRSVEKAAKGGGGDSLKCLKDVRELCLSTHGFSYCGGRICDFVRGDRTSARRRIAFEANGWNRCGEENTSSCRLYLLRTQWVN